MADVNRYLVYLFVKRANDRALPKGATDDRVHIVRAVLDTTDHDRAVDLRNRLTPMYGDNIRLLSYTVADGKNYVDYLKTHKDALK